MLKRISPVPVNYFAIVLGLLGLGLSWRYGSSIGLLPAWPGHVLLLTGAVLWFFLLCTYIYKWVCQKNAALEELHHVIQCCFISLIPITTLLMGITVLPYSRVFSWLLLAAGIIGQLGFAAYRGGGLWRGTHVDEATTPIIYLPAVAANFVCASAMGATGHLLWGTLFFGAGMLSWLSLEAAILHRLRTMQALAAAARPVIGIQLAPAFVGCAAYLSINGGVVDVVALALIGYGILQAIFLVRLLPWAFEEGFTPSFWAFSFGLASMAGCGLRMITFYSKTGEKDLLPLGWGLFGMGTFCIVVLIAFTLVFFVKKIPEHTTDA